MIHDNFYPLEWDTGQLGVLTAKIITDAAGLPEMLSLAKSRGFRLIYWTTENTPEAVQAAQKYHGLLVDHKVTYFLDLSCFKDHSNQVVKTQIYHENNDLSESSQLIKLAYESGQYSRFRKDSHLTDDQFKNIYRVWMENSINHTVAEEVLVIRENQAILGMATVGKKNHRGDTGLLAVAPEARGRHIGTALLEGAHAYFRQKNYLHVQVVTQKENIPACRLYEKCGYSAEETVLFFHFWI